MTQTLAQPVQVSTQKPRRREVRAVSVDPVVGKDILELLSSAMYLDPRTIYREYIQNCADAFDDAFSSGILKDDEFGRVDVALDADGRTVRIRDNGTGVRTADAERILTAFGASAKRGTEARGFRGVGRLSAFGYAQSVSFKTKARGESVATEVRWDCRRLKTALLDPSYKADLRQLVRDVVTVASEEDPDENAHYFEVTLERVIRVKDDALLDADEVARYLGEVAPAPFHPGFEFGKLIDAHVAPYIRPCRFRIYINDAPESVFRPHRQTFDVTTARTDEVSEVETIVLEDPEFGARAVGWILHHGYTGTIHAAQELRGLRARVGDVQVGTGDVFLDAFQEKRFNSWTIGELHILDRRVIPNGRRDSFEQNQPYLDLLGDVAIVARRQEARCRRSSTRRNRLRTFDAREQKVWSLFEVLRQSSVSPARKIGARREIGTAFNELKRLARASVLSEFDRRSCQRRLDRLEARLDGLRELADVADPFAGASSRERAVYSQMVDLIYDCSPNKAVARRLVDKIMARLVARAIRLKRRAKRRPK